LSATTAERRGYISDAYSEISDLDTLGAIRIIAVYWQWSAMSKVVFLGTVFTLLLRNKKTSQLDKRTKY